MDNTFISGYQQTLQQLKTLFSQRSPILIKKGEIFVNYGEKNQRLGILLSGLMYASYFSKEFCFECIRNENEEMLDKQL